jgi:hypothetical protein
MVTMAQTASIVVAGASIAALASQPTMRGNLMAWTGYNAPGGLWRIATILLALLNLKNLPFVWHVRIWCDDRKRDLKLTISTATLHSRLVLPTISPTDPDPSACALPAYHNLDAYHVSRNRL